MKEVIDKLDFIEIKKMLCEIKCQESEKISHRLAENICKRRI